MRDWLSFIKTMLLVEAAALTTLLCAGWILSVGQGNDFTGRTFFTYHVRHFDQTPYWIVASLALMATNGFWLFRLAHVEAGFTTSRIGPCGLYNLQIPVNHLRLFAINLVAVPILITAFVVIRTRGF
jgi:hypothetical protein